MLRIILNNISWNRSDGSALFKDLTITFNEQRTGLVGKNGTGKSTIAKIISALTKPSGGSVNIEGRVKYLPQDISIFESKSVIEVLGIAEKYFSHKRILNGFGSEDDYLILNDDWTLEEKILNLLAENGLQHVHPERLYKSLSGGEKVKCIFASLLIDNPDFVILDEPTNHLDQKGREAVYKYVSGWKKGLIAISHDRELLRMMDTIVELTPIGAKVYGGNFDFYIQQKEIEISAATNFIKHAKTELKKNLTQKFNAVTKQEKRNREAEKNSPKQNIAPISLNRRRGLGEQTLKKIKEVHNRRIEESKELLSKAKSRLPYNRQIKIDIPFGKNYETRTIIRAEELNISFNKKMLWKNPLNIIVRGGERIVLCGVNGSGKTTILKMITGEVKPSKGKLYVGTDRIGMLDQLVSVLNDELNLLDNLKFETKGKIPEHELRIRLGRFLFYKDDVFKNAKALSGGERMRAGLACLLESEKTPELLILDEPTNNLDLESIEELASALNNYKGTLIVVSHDKDFLLDIGIKREINLDTFFNVAGI